MNQINRLLVAAGRRQDLVFVALLATTLAVMILPMPPAGLDVLIALNLSLTAVILLISVYLDRATSFSTFPTVILLATTFRLAISIATTRSVLSIADGGEIVNTFGRFVTGGNIAIGLVIFLIISIVQFVVVTKGAERIAEVAARFVLDALPGRQMSIDAELRAGEIGQDEARRRRAQIDKENQFFGAMDGAMKFVKGDAITGLMIVAVNLIGGLAVGLFQNHMTLGEAVETYSLLTIGDGLVAQLPALLIAMSAGIINTRVTHADSQGDLGSDVMSELLRSPRGLGMAGAVVGALGFVPGFPIVVFLGIGGAIVGFSVLLRRRRDHAADASSASPETVAAALAASPRDRAVLRCGPGLYASLSPEALVAARAERAAAFEARYGIALPPFAVAQDEDLDDDKAVLEFDGVPVADARIAAGEVVALAESTALQLAGVHSFAACPSLQTGVVHAFLAPSEARDALERAEIAYWTTEQALARFAFAAMSSSVSSLVGFELVQAQLRALREDHPDLADHVSAVAPVVRVVEIARRLAAERVPLKPARVLYEAIAEWAPRYPDADLVAEHVRHRLASQICHTLADETRNVPCYVLAPDLEQALRASVKPVQGGVSFQPSAALVERLVTQARQIRSPLDPTAPAPALLTSPDLRRHLRYLFTEFDILTPVLSHGEIAREYRVYPVGSLLLSGAPSAQAA